MNEEQKARALALRRVHGVYRWCESPRMPREWILGHMGIKGERIGGGNHPTRLDAIVAALLALEPGR